MQESTGSPDAVSPAVEQLAGRLGRDQVFGPPVEQAGAVLVPVARVRAGGGYWPGRRGQPDGVRVRPLGAFSISAEGRAAWHPAVDVNRIVLGGQLALLGVVAIVGAVLGRRVPGARRGTRRLPG